MNDIRPGAQVMILRLPISVNAFALIPEFTHRVYGTGAMMRLAGDQVSISAPAEGLGPRLTDPFPEVTIDESVMIRELTCTDLDDGSTGIEWTLEGAQESLGLFVESQVKMMDGLGATNYIISDIAIGDAEPTLQVVVQRKTPGALSPHEARLAAEKREQDLIASIRNATNLLLDGNVTVALETLVSAAAAAA